MLQYRFKGNAKHREGGKRLSAGDVVEMDEKRAAGLADRFVRVGDDATQPTGVGSKPQGVRGDKPAPDSARVRAALEGNLEDAAAAIAKMDRTEIAELLRHENSTAGKGRKGVVAAADARMAELDDDGS